LKGEAKNIDDSDDKKFKQKDKNRKKSKKREVKPSPIAVDTSQTPSSEAINDEKTKLVKSNLEDAANSKPRREKSNHS
jgi:hypothetical protein